MITSRLVSGFDVGERAFDAFVCLGLQTKKKGGPADWLLLRFDSGICGNIEFAAHPDAWLPDDIVNPNSPPVLVAIGSVAGWVAFSRDRFDALDVSDVRLAGDVPMFIRHMNSCLAILSEFADDVAVDEQG